MVASVWSSVLWGCALLTLTNAKHIRQLEPQTPGIDGRDKQHSTEKTSSCRNGRKAHPLMDRPHEFLGKQRTCESTENTISAVMAMVSKPSQRHVDGTGPKASEPSSNGKATVQVARRRLHGANLFDGSCFLARGLVAKKKKKRERERERFHTVFRLLAKMSASSLFIGQVIFHSSCHLSGGWCGKKKSIVQKICTNPFCVKVYLLLGS